MDIDRAKEMLKRRKTRYKEASYATEKEYWRHICEYYYFEHASDNRVRALVIPCGNGERSIELQFTENNGSFIFTELYFGTFCFELSESAEEGEERERELNKHLGNLLEGRYTVVTAADINAGRLVFDGFSPDMPPDTKQRLADRIGKANSIWGRLARKKFAYEIYDSESMISGRFNSINKFWKATEILRGSDGEEEPEE